MTDLTAALTVSKPKKYRQKINTNRYIDDVVDGDDGDDGTNFSGCGQQWRTVWQTSLFQECL